MGTKKKIIIGVGGLIALALVGAGGFVGCQVSSFDSSMSKQYDVALPEIAASGDPALIERGQHLAESIGGCTDCHGSDLGGKLMADMGPIGLISTPNITSGGIGGEYSDAELARVLLDGVKRDGTSLVFMPSWDFRWWPDRDIVALVSWWRTLPPIDRPDGELEIRTMGKVLDRLDYIPIDVARRIDHGGARETAPEPSPTPEYGRFIAKLCQGCHGPTLSGGPIPGAPPDMPVPSNITPHDTGLGAWSEEDFRTAIETGVRPDGRELDPMMPVATLAAMDETEKTALWLYLRSVEPKAFGGR